MRRDGDPRPWLTAQLTVGTIVTHPTPEHLVLWPCTALGLGATSHQTPGRICTLQSLPPAYTADLPLPAAHKCINRNCGGHTELATTIGRERVRDIMDSDKEEEPVTLAPREQANPVISILKKIGLRSLAWVGVYLLGYFDFSVAWMVTPLLLSVLR